MEDNLILPDANDDGGVRTPEELATLLGDSNIAQQTFEKPKETEGKFKFQPKIFKNTTVEEAKKLDTPITTVTDPKVERDLLDKRIADLEKGIKLLQESRDNIVLRAASIPKKEIDWSKISEKDVFDASIPMEVIDHSMPDYMKVEPKDPAFVLRWVHKLGRRVGPMKAKGFRFCTLEDIAGEVNIAIEINADGRIQFDDVYLMMIEKSLYYGMLRKNHMRALSMVDPKKAHIFAKGRVEAELNNATRDSNMPNDKTMSGDYGRYQSDKRKMDVYAPGYEI